MTDKKTPRGKVTWIPFSERAVLPSSGFVHLGPLFPPRPEKASSPAESVDQDAPEVDE